MRSLFKLINVSILLLILLLLTSNTIRLFWNFRRKCTSPNTLSIQVPVFSCLGQSLPDLNQVTASSSTGGPMLLVPPRGSPHRGTSYPPPSPPLRRAPAISRNPPLLKTRNVASASSTTFVTSCELDVPVVIAGQSWSKTLSILIKAKYRWFVTVFPKSWRLQTWNLAQTIIRYIRTKEGFWKIQSVSSKNHYS